ncbi:MAG: hypothetical protein Q4D92_04810 [Slackia sp.]|nr:hypothetical protein [Slackia sp.]
MSNQQTHSYVNGTAALKIRHDRYERFGAAPKVIRVDFDARKTASAMRSNEDETPVYRSFVPMNGEASRVRSMCARHDLSVVVDALGFKEMREELEHGSAAGLPMRKGSFALTTVCCACLFAFCLFVLAL